MIKWRKVQVMRRRLQRIAELAAALDIEPLDLPRYASRLPLAQALDSITRGAREALKELDDLQKGS